MTELLIVDDDDALRHWAERVVRERGYGCDAAANAADARELLSRDGYQLALLDVNMPGESGVGLLSHIRREHPDTAVVMVTGEDDPKLAMDAIELGAFGYMVKPVGAGELLINVANAMHRRSRELESRRMLQSLRAAADQRGNRLEDALEDLRRTENKVWVSQAETIFRLARVVEFRDEETGHHLQRMSSYCELLARKLGFRSEDAERLRLASQLHDVGKVAIPDSILLKRGKLSSEEFAVIMTHAETGHTMLAGSSSDVVQLGATIAQTHHERWDGCGYPRALARQEIPLEGRIAAIADVFDALTSDRVYRPAFPVKTAVEMMRSERGAHFDPEILDAFLTTLGELESIRRAYAD
ncbi:MAG TPA: HD domain-containing phosphohydrolase [Solirubrobacteraceae bacterium]